MPVYEYKCQTCGETFDVFRSFQDKETEVKCPKCGGTETKKVYSTFGTCSSVSSCRPVPTRFG